MPQPILTVSSATSQSKKAQVNLLPCRVHHDGSINSIETYWNPTEDGGKLVKQLEQIHEAYC
jgi:hypothetical protein